MSCRSTGPGQSSSRQAGWGRSEGVTWEVGNTSVWVGGMKGKIILDFRQKESALLVVVRMEALPCGRSRFESEYPFAEGDRFPLPPRRASGTACSPTSSLSRLEAH